MIDREGEVGRILFAADRLDEGAMLELGVRPRGEEAEELERARRSAFAAAERARLRHGIEWLQGEVARAGATSQLAPVAGVYLPDRLLGDLRRQALPAIFDAALAAYLGGMLDATSREVLLRRWRHVTDPDDELHP